MHVIHRRGWEIPECLATPEHLEDRHNLAAAHRARRYSAACRATGSGRQRRTGLRAAVVSSRRRRGVSRGAV